MPRPTGTLELGAEEFRAMIVAVAEEAAEARQQAYDATYDVLSETITPQEAAQLLATMKPEDLTRMILEAPAEATALIRQMRMIAANSDQGEKVEE